MDRMLNGLLALSWFFLFAFALTFALNDFDVLSEFADRGAFFIGG